MRKIYLLTILTLVALPVFAYQLDHHGNQFSFYIEREFHRIRAPDFFLEGTPGHPELPVKYIHYIIPANMKVDSIRITINRMSQISGSYYIYPAQPEVPLCSIPPWVPPDSIIYNSDSLYPNKLVEVANDGVFDGARLVTIAVYPLQYRPLSRRVSLVSNVTFEFRLSSTGIPRRAQRRGINVQRTYNAMLAAAVENDWEIPLYYQPPTLVLDEPPGTPITPAAYTIITNNEIPGMMEAFQPFADWLTDKGIPAVVYPLSFALAYPGEDEADKLRNFIIDAYTNYGTAWVLLGGDAGIVPYRKGQGYPNYDYEKHQCPSDLYFSDMNGKWDVDKDHFWGEQSGFPWGDQDSVDLYPEVLVGRILSRSSIETQNWVYKILYYEQIGSTNLELLKQTTWIYDNRGGEPYDIYPYPWTRERFPTYFLHENYDHTNACEALVALNEGAGLYQIYCHGVTQKFQVNSGLNQCILGWSDDPPLPEYAGLNSLTNDGRYYVVYDIACCNAAYDPFDLYHWEPGVSGTFVPSDTSIADAFSDAYPGIGAVAFLGNTRQGYLWISHELHDAFCKLLFGNGGMYSLGAAEGWSKVIFTPHHEPWWHIIHAHNLFGSPENEPWINRPGTMEVDHLDFIPVGQTMQFTVSVWDVNSPSHTPLPGVRVCLHKNDSIPHEIYEIGWTDNNGSVTFEICATYPGELKVTCFRPREVPDGPDPSLSYIQYLPSRTTCQVGLGPDGEQAEKAKLPKELSLTAHSSILSKNNLKLSYGLPKDGKVKITVYDLYGREMMTLKDERMNAGYCADAFNLERLSNGIYWLVLKSGNETKTKKLVLIK